MTSEINDDASDGRAIEFATLVERATRNNYMNDLQGKDVFSYAFKAAAFYEAALGPIGRVVRSSDDMMSSYVIFSVELHQKLGPIENFVHVIQFLKKGQPVAKITDKLKNKQVFETHIKHDGSITQNWFQCG